MCKCELCNRMIDDYELSLTNDNKCIFHCRKNEENGWYTEGSGLKEWNKDKVNYFWKEIREYIKIVDEEDPLIENTKIPYSIAKLHQKYIFRDFIFPEFDFDNSMISRDSKNFFNEKESIFKKDVEFIKCIFLDDVNLIFTNFKGILYIDDTTFHGDVNFSRCKFDDFIKIEKLILNYYEIDFSFSEFKNRVEFDIKRAPSNISLNMQVCKFRDTVKFDELNLFSFLLQESIFDNICNFNAIFITEKMDLKKVSFFDVVSFDDSVFLEIIDFENTIFYQFVSFRNVTLENFDLSRTSFLSNSNFLNIHTIENKSIEVESRETARVIKDSFEQQNNIIEANKYYALEMKEREKELSKDIKKGKNILDWLVFKFHGLSSNHSQSWLLALLCILIIGLSSSIYEFKFIDLDKSLLDQIHQNMNEQWLSLLFGIGMFAIVCSLIMSILNISKSIYLLLFSLFFTIYIFLTSDIKFVLFAKTINPFSIMSGKESLDVFQLLFKVIIAYLIYQFIISIRQNTRRK